VGDHSAVDEHVVTGHENFGHDVALVAIELDGVLGSQVVEAVGFGLSVAIEGTAAISVDDGEAILVKLVTDIAAGFDDELIFGLVHLSDELHEGGFTTTDGTGEEDSFSE